MLLRGVKDRKRICSSESTGSGTTSSYFSKEAPSKHYHAIRDKETGNYSLSLKNGKPVTVSKVAKMLNDLEDSPKAVAAREKEETDAKEKAAAKEKEAKDTDTPEKTANASMVAALVTQSSQETPTKKKNLTIKIRQTIPKTEHQKDVLHEHQDKARRMLNYEDRMITQKRQRLAWIEGGRGREKETEKKLAIATRELSIGPGKKLLK
jgi:hypothetical protein